MISRIRDADGRFVFFVVAGVILIGLALGGYFNASGDVVITRQEAIDIARPLIDFEPVSSDSRLVRQGVQVAPVWAVYFTVPVEGDPRSFERLMTIEIDARTGDVLRISTDGKGTIAPDS